MSEPDCAMLKQQVEIVSMVFFFNTLEHSE